MQWASSSKMQCADEHNSVVRLGTVWKKLPRLPVEIVAVMGKVC